MANVNFYDVIEQGGQTPAERFAAMTKDADSFYSVADDLYIGSHKLTSADDLAVAVGNIAQNAADITTINNTLTKLQGAESTSGSIKNLIRAYLNTLDSTATIASKSGNVISIRPQVEQVNGTIAPAGTAIDFAAVAATGAASDVSYDNSASGLTATDVKSAIDEVASQSAGGVGSKTIFVEDKSASQSVYAKVYEIYQCATQAEESASTLRGTINIPKDLFIKSASVETVTVADEPYEGAEVGDKYIDIEVQNQTDHIYVPCNSLVDEYTAEQGATQIQLVIDSNNVISATVVAGSIGATELASDAVVTAKIADGNVTKAKLAQSVQNSLDLADSAIQSVTEGTTAGAILVGSSIVPVHGLANVATSGNAADVAYDNTASGMTATDMQDAVDELKDAIDNIDVSGDIQDAIEALDGSAVIASKSGNAVTLKAGIVEADGIVENSSNADIVLADVAVTGAATDVAYVNGSIATVAGALNDLYDQIGAGGSVQEMIDAAIEALDTASDVAVASQNASTGDVTISGSIKEEDGVIAKGTASDIVLKKVATTGKAEDLAVDDTDDYFTGTNAETILAEIGRRLTWQEV